MRASVLLLGAFAGACQASHNVATMLSGEISLSGSGDFGAVPANCTGAPVQRSFTLMATSWKEYEAVITNSDGIGRFSTKPGYTQFGPGAAAIDVDFVPLDVGDSTADLEIRNAQTLLDEAYLSATVVDAGTLGVSPTEIHFTPSAEAEVQVVHGWPNPLSLVVSATTGDSANVDPFTLVGNTCANPAPACTPCTLRFRSPQTTPNTMVLEVLITGYDSKDGTRAPPPVTITLEWP